MITGASSPEKKENGGRARRIKDVISKHHSLGGVFLEFMLHMFRQAFDIVQYLHFFVQARRQHSWEKPLFLEADGKPLAKRVPRSHTAP
jgi:hypothetical protein